MTTEAIMQTPPVQCPPWCVSTHSHPFERRVEDEYHDRLHTVVIGTVDAGAASVEVVRHDDLSTGAAGPLRVVVVNDDDLTARQASQLAAFIVKAVMFIEGANRAN